MPTASDLRERTTQTDVDLMQRINRGRPVIEGPQGLFIRWDAVMEALAAIRAEAKAEGWEDAVKALRGQHRATRKGDDPDYVSGYSMMADWLAANRPKDL